MDAFEINTQSFIVKIWVEESPQRVDELIWRGQITHVLSGERFELENLDDISSFMSLYLQEEDKSGQFGQR
jgi:hypothetical protein